MGEFVRHLARISEGYELYITSITNRYGSTAERVLETYFRVFAMGIGEDNVISEIIDWEGIKEVENKFQIKDTESRPILIITDVHPNRWKKEHGMIKIALGEFRDKDELKDFLFLLSRRLSSGEMKSIAWELRYRKMKEFAKLTKAIVSLAR